MRAHANLVLTNPDMLSAGCCRSTRAGRLPARPALRRDRRVPRLPRGLRLARRAGAPPAAPGVRALRRRPDLRAGLGDRRRPGSTASRLTGLPVEVVDDDASPAGPLTFALYEPPLTELRGEHGAPVRRSALSETADLLADLVADGVPTLAFVRSRGGGARRRRSRHGGRCSPSAVREGAAAAGGSRPTAPATCPRSGARSRRPCAVGKLLGLAATNALELGVDVSGLDAVLLAGFPGTLASLWQQAGRAGRRGRRRSRCCVARDDPLDTYLVHHPEAVFGRPVEAAVLDPDNPYVLEPHLECAAAELPLTRGRPGALRHRRRGRRRRPGAPGPAPAPARRAGSGPPGSGRGSTCAAPAARRSRWSRSPTGRLLGTVDRGSCAHARAPGRGLPAPGRVLSRATPWTRTTAAPSSSRADVDWTTTARDAHRPAGRRGAAPPAGRPARPSASAPSTSPTRWSATYASGSPPARCSARSRSTCPPASCGPGRSGTSSRRPAAGARGARLRPTSRAPLTPPSTPRSGCCRCSRPATAGTSAASRPRCTPTPARRRSSSTTARPGGAGFAERGFRPHRRLAGGHEGSDRRLRMRDRLPVVRPVAQVRQRQRAARQGRRLAAARGGHPRAGGSLTGPARASARATGGPLTETLTSARPSASAHDSELCAVV